MIMIQIFILIQEPLFLNRCIVTEDPTIEDIFEIMETNKEPIIFKVRSILPI